MKSNKLPSIVILLILTTITAIFWVSFSVYHVFTRKDGIIVPDEITQSINPNLDMDTLSEIEKRNQDQ